MANFNGVGIESHSKIKRCQMNVMKQNDTITRGLSFNFSSVVLKRLFADVQIADPCVSSLSFESVVFLSPSVSCALSLSD